MTKIMGVSEAKEDGGKIGLAGHDLGVVRAEGVELAPLTLLLLSQSQWNT